MQLLLWRQLQQYGYVLIALIIALSVIGIRQFGGLQGLELKTFDSRVRHYATDAGLPEVIVVGITEGDIRHYKQWPLRDNTVAELLEHLQAYQPVAIGLDIYRDIEYPPGHDRLAQQLAVENVYGVYDVGLNPTHNSPPPEGMASSRTGFADFVADADGVIRRLFMFAAVEPNEFYAFSLRLSLHALRNHYGLEGIKKNLEGLTLADTLFPRLTPNAGSYQNEDTTGYQVMLQYRTRNEAIQ
ncbi:CHASE2 domain-containing protein, partial [Leptolyngbya cf. ectocarpi LEGE 11479]